jgi:hypothetical protein
VLEFTPSPFPLPNAFRESLPQSARWSTLESMMHHPTRQAVGVGSRA